MVREVAGRAEADAFLDLPARLAPLGWGVPLRFEQALLFDRARNGFLRTHTVARFLAWRDGAVVGRIAGCVPQDATATASFGFLCCEADAAVVAALVEAVRGWIAGPAGGRSAMQGPLSFTINHEVGAQIDAFDRPPMLRMPRTPPWLPAMLDAAGLEPSQDVVACTLDMARECHRARYAALVAARGAEASRLRIRPLNRRDFGAEMRHIATLFNAAWAANWGAVKLGSAEVETLAGLLRPLLWRGEVLFAEWDGAPAGLLSLVPNIEPALPAHGRVLSPAALRLALALVAPPALGGVGSARIPMLGILPEFRGHPAGAWAMGGLLARAFDIAQDRGWRSVEISWILEHNPAMRNAMARLGAPVSGRWRIWRTAHR